MLEENDWHNVLDANVMGTARVSKQVIRGMMMKRWGRIINLSSVAATKAGRGQSNYAASKGAIEAMSRGLACEIGSRGITVNCIAPGVIETDMSEEVRKLASDEILDRQVVKRFGNPTEIAAWAVFLASDYGGFMTGQTIHIDGGMKMP
jgi:3-oxoacyl-[acyl-carrier protein] reductase